MQGVPSLIASGLRVQGYLAHKKHPLHRTIQRDYFQGPMVVLGEGAVFSERGTPVAPPRQTEVGKSSDARALGGSQGGGRFLMGEVPLYCWVLRLRVSPRNPLEVKRL